MDAVSEIIQNQGVVVLDGGLATELERRGENLNDPLWSAKILLSAPEKIRDVHASYFAAGADVAITASYQATIPGLVAKGLSEKEAETVIVNSVRVAQQAREGFGHRRTLVAASVGPYGAFLHDGSEYRGDYGANKNDLRQFHRRRMQILAASGADLLACESIPSLEEAAALVELLEELPSTPAWISFTCKDDEHISDGTPFADAVALVTQSSHVMAAGLNCTAPRYVAALLEKGAKASKKPMVVYPNSGELYDAATCSWVSTPDGVLFEQAVQGWYANGARLIGGCCRTTPDTIRSIRQALTSSLAHAGNN